MRTANVLLLAFLLIGCQKAEEKPPAADGSAKADKPDAPPLLKLPPAPGAKPAPPKPAEKVPPVEPPPEPAPKRPPIAPPAPPAAGAGDLAAAITKLNGYENTFGKKAGEPVHYQFRSPGPTDAELETLRPLLLKSPVKVHLNFNQCSQITDTGVAHLKGVPTLQRLWLGGTKVTDAGLKDVGTLTQLDELSVGNDLITDAGIAHLSKLTKLRKFYSYGKNVTGAAFAHLADMTELEEVGAGGSSDFDDTKLKHMARITKLKVLSLAGPNLTDEGMASLKNMTELRELRIDGEKVTAAGVANLAGLTKLQKLTVFKCGGFKGEALAALDGMQDLTDLELIYAPSIDKDGSAHIGKLTKLKRLRFGGVSAEGLSGLTGLTGLEQLTLLYSGVGDGDLKYVAKLTGLKELSLYATRVTDEGLKQLAGMPALRMLDLSENRELTDSALEAAAAIPNLEELRLSNCPKVTGIGLKAVAKLAKLKGLWVNGDPVTDENALALKAVKTLEHLDLAGTKVSDEAALEIKTALPKARVLDASNTAVSLDQPAPPKPKPKGEDLTDVKPDFTLTAEAFQKEYSDDKVAAEKKYKGKVIELSGEVHTIGRLGGDTPYIGLKAGKELLGVPCATADQQPWGTAVPGQVVKLKGRWPKDAYGVALTQCVFTDKGKYKAVPVTAAELAKEFEADPKATVAKYDKKHLVLSGEVAAKEFNSAGAATITFKTDGKIKVKCSFTASENDYAKPLKAGQKLTAVGEFTLNFDTSDEVTVYFCYPLSKP